VKLQGYLVGKSAGYKILAVDDWRSNSKGSRYGYRQEKPLASDGLTVPQTDTGRQVEDTKAREITLVKELGKLTP